MNSIQLEISSPFLSFHFFILPLAPALPQATTSLLVGFSEAVPCHDKTLGWEAEGQLEVCHLAPLTLGFALNSPRFLLITCEMGLRSPDWSKAQSYYKAQKKIIMSVNILDTG